MSWDPTQPVTNAALLSAPVRDNFVALNTALMATLAAGPTQSLLTITAGGGTAALAPGTAGHVLTMAAGVPGWAAPTGGMTSPMTAPGDLIVGTTGGAPARLGVGTNGHVLTLAAGLPAWAAPTGGGLSNPMVAVGDLIVGTTGGAPARLGVGTNGHVLTLAAGLPAWAAPTGGGLSNPMVAVGDLIVGTTGGAPARLGVGTNGHVLTLAAGLPAWAAPTGGGRSNPMVAVGDLIVGTTAGAPGRLGVGTDTQILAVAGGTPTWTNPSSVATVAPLALARVFPGGVVTDKITVTRYAEIDNLTTLSVSAWVWRTASTTNVILQKGAAGPSVYNTVGTYNFQAKRWTTTHGLWRFTPPAAGNWHHIVWTYSYASTSTVPVGYLNGDPAVLTAVSTPAGTATLNDSAANLVIGNETDTYGWSGRLAQVAIWNRILTADEVRYLYALSPTTPQYGGTLATGLVLHLPLDGTSSPEPNTVKPANPGVVTGTTSAAAPNLFVPVGLASGYQNPMTQIGDLIVGTTAGQPSRFAAVASGAVLASAGVGVTPTWSTAPTLTSLSLSGALYPLVTLNKSASGGASDVISQTAGLYRWQLRMGDTTAESGGNAGSDFALFRFTDGGALIDCPMTIVRSDGTAYFRIVDVGALRGLRSGAADSGGAGYRMLRVAN